MRLTINRWLCVALTFLLSLSYTGAPCVFATSDYELIYELSGDGTATITGYEGNATEITIPGSIDGYEVTTIGTNAFATTDSDYYNDNDSYNKIKKIVIEEGITTISYDAFYNCRDLSEIVLPNSLDKVCSGAFMGCVSLKTANIPENTDIATSCLGVTIDFSCYNPDSNGNVVMNVEDFVIYGYNNSSAYNYAFSHSFTFVSLDDAPIATTTQPMTITTTEPITLETAYTTTISTSNITEVTDTIRTSETETTTAVTTTISTSNTTEVTATNNISETETTTASTNNVTEATATNSTSETETTTTTVVTDYKNIAAEDFINWAKNDYQSKTGISPTNAVLSETSDGYYEITLTDEVGNVLDIYTIDPVTATGTNQNNEEVNLPQTGYSNWYHTAAALAGCATVIGGVMIIGSGVLKKKR